MGLFKVFIISSPEIVVAGGTSFDINLPLLKQYLMLKPKGFVVEAEHIVPLRLHQLIL
jgi:hypothetical protein